MPQQKPQTYSTKIMRPRRAGLPLRPFLYTMDQIADILQVTLDDLLRPMNKWVHYYGINSGIPSQGKLVAHNVGPTHSPDWRVSEDDLIRWLESRGWNVTDAKQIVSESDKEHRS
jgi:hypothetical protein